MRSYFDATVLNPKGCEVIQLIATTLTRHGDGRGHDPVRVVTQLWTLDGQLVAECDPIREEDIQGQGEDNRKRMERMGLLTRPQGHED